MKNFNKKIILIEYNLSKFTKIDKYLENKNIKIIRFYDKNSIDIFLTCIQEKTLIISANNEYFLFSKQNINNKNLFIINFHNSLLPYYKGMNAPMWCIYNNEKYSGCTWHVVDEKIDNGDILIQQTVPLNDKITAFELTKILINLGEKLLDKIIKNILSQNITTTKQTKITQKPFRKKALPNDGFIDLLKTKKHISRHLRSMDFNKSNLIPPAKVLLNDKVYQVVSYKIQENKILLNLKDQLTKTTHVIELSS